MYIFHCVLHAYTMHDNIYIAPNCEIIIYTIQGDNITFKRLIDENLLELFKNTSIIFNEDTSRILVSWWPVKIENFAKFSR